MNLRAKDAGPAVGARSQHRKSESLREMTSATKRHAIRIFVVAIAVSIFEVESEPNEDWKFVKQSSGVAIYNRPHPGSRLKEFKAVGEIDAPTRTVHNVIDDVDA